MNLDHSFNSNPFLTIAIVDFNAKTNKWSESDRSNIEGSKIDFLTSQFSISKIIEEPAHILENSSSCIDLTFTTQPNMVLESRVHHSLHQNCHHQIIFSKFNLKAYYPPPYERTIFQMLTIFNKQLIFLIGRMLSSILMLILKCPFFSSTLLNILNNYIPHETKICEDRDSPWMTTKIKKTHFPEKQAIFLY